MSLILVIEDEKGIQSILEAVLSRYGHCVTTAADGKEGIQKSQCPYYRYVRHSLAHGRIRL
jgi:CheY-like chemotaxis protein